MVVEDEPRLRDVLVSGIREMGFSARGARSAEEALRLFCQAPDDILIVDLNLPGMDGMEFFEIIRGRWPGTSVIIVTGNGSLLAAQRAIRLNVVDFLTKPVSLGDLERALNLAWQKHIPLESLTPTESPDLERASQKTLDEIEREQIYAALERNKGSRSATAAELGISVRTLYYKLATYQNIDALHDEE